MIIFGLLCGLLYLIGHITGLSYEEISVLLCCHILPQIIWYISIICFIISFINIFKTKNLSYILIFILGVLWSVIPFIIMCCFSEAYPYHCVGEWQDISTSFHSCKRDLIQWAQIYNYTYEEINLIIFVYGFFLLNQISIIFCYNEYTWYKITFFIFTLLFILCSISLFSIIIAHWYLILSCFTIIFISTLYLIKFYKS